MKETQMNEQHQAADEGAEVCEGVAVIFLTTGGEDASGWMCCNWVGSYIHMYMQSCSYIDM